MPTLRPGSSAGTVRDCVFALMREAGMTTVFGNPGSTELRFMRDWPGDFRYVTALHEGCAVAMADAYAQLTRNTAFVNLHSAGGLGNAMGSVFTAFKNQTPIVITAGQQSRAAFPTVPYLYAQDATTLPAPYVKWAYEPARAQDVPAAIERAYHTALLPPAGPTFVSIPEDDWDHEAEASPLRRVSAGVRASRDALDAVLQALRTSLRPALVVGPGVDRDAASDAAVAIAECVGAAVFVSPFSSRCSFPERHPNFAGFLPPVRTAIVEALREYDLVVVLGAPLFTYHVYAGGPAIASGTRVFHLTDDPAAVTSAAAGTSILTTLREPLEAILRALATSKPASPATARKAAAPVVDSKTLTGAAALQTLARTMPEGTIVVEEAPSHRNAMHDYLPIERPGSFYAAASGSLGWALPASVGAALARPAQRIVAVLGDGSSMYAIQGIWTAVRFSLPITFLILNNGAYAAMNQFSRYLGVAGTPSFALDGLNFVLAAEAFGARGTRVDDTLGLEEALRASFASPLPSLVEAVLDDPVAEIY